MLFAPDLAAGPIILRQASGGRCGGCRWTGTNFMDRAGAFQTWSMLAPSKYPFRIGSWPFQSAGPRHKRCSRSQMWPRVKVDGISVTSRETSMQEVSRLKDHSLEDYGACYAK